MCCHILSRASIFRSPWQGPFGRGWLNAAGTLATLSSDEVEVNFSDFWIDACLLQNDKKLIFS